MSTNKVIRFSIGLHSKHAWAGRIKAVHERVETVNDRAIDFEIPRLKVIVHFPCNTWIYSECKEQNGSILLETL